MLSLRQGLAERISIHALREEGDSLFAVKRFDRIISIHALREEGDHCLPSCSDKRRGFLSTPSARRATIDMAFRKKAFAFLSTPSARRATNVMIRGEQIWEISIHALREEGDSRAHCRVRRKQEFLSTPSARRATILPGYRPGRAADFYPRPPRGGRRRGQSVEESCKTISIHALREEGDLSRFGR